MGVWDHEQRPLEYDRAMYGIYEDEVRAPAIQKEQVMLPYTGWYIVEGKSGDHQAGRNQLDCFSSYAEMSMACSSFA
jgi:hypothetical protein